MEMNMNQNPTGIFWWISNLAKSHWSPIWKQPQPIGGKDLPCEDLRLLVDSLPTICCSCLKFHEHFWQSYNHDRRDSLLNANDSPINPQQSIPCALDFA